MTNEDKEKLRLAKLAGDEMAKDRLNMIIYLFLKDWIKEDREKHIRRLRCKYKSNLTPSDELERE